MTGNQAKTPRMPPPWFIRGAWAVHRAFVRLTGGRRGHLASEGQEVGTLRLTTIGRRTGRERVAILGYYEDGPNLVTLAMNGWMPGEPAWWLNLQEHPETTSSSRMDRGRSAPARRRVTNEYACGRCSGDGRRARRVGERGDLRRPPS